MSGMVNWWRGAALVVAAVAALLAPSAATAAPTDSPDDTVICVSESLTLYSAYDNDYTCFGAPKEVIDPPFPAARAHNGYQRAWCVFSEQNFRGWVVRVPSYQWVNVNMPVASATWC